MGRVMIVDDSSLMRRVIRSMIVNYSSHEVIAEAENATEALEKFRENQPDLVTMDISMDEVDGIAAMKLILVEFPQAKIVMISSVNEKEKVLEAMSSGANYYILKPINVSKIQSMLERIFKSENPAENSALPAPATPDK